MKKILFAASECVPFMKTGGLADVVGALPKEFDKKEWDVRVVMPNYRGIADKFRNNFEYITHFYMGTGPYVPNAHVGIMKYEYEGITYYFIDNLDYFGAERPYADTRTDVEKYIFFCKAVLVALPHIPSCEMPSHFCNALTVGLPSLPYSTADKAGACE